MVNQQILAQPRVLLASVQTTGQPLRLFLNSDCNDPDQEHPRPGKTLRSLIDSVSAQTGAYQRETARAGRMGRDCLRTISSGNREASAGW